MAIIESPAPVGDSEGIGVPAAIELLLGVLVVPAELGDITGPSHKLVSIGISE